MRDASAGVRRRRECKCCGARFSTIERVETATPLLIKQNGNREQFDRQRLITGIRMACAKRPVSAAAINRVVDDIEAVLRQVGSDEVPSGLWVIWSCGVCATWTRSLTFATR